MTNHLSPPTMDCSANDDLPTFHVLIPDILQCAPANARRVGGRHATHPLYAESLVDAATPITKAGSTPWSMIRVEAVEPEFAVTFNKRQSSFAGLSVKTGRAMSGLGPHEHAVFRELEANPRWIDFDLQTIRTSWSNDTGGFSYTGDWIAVDEDACVHAGEMKASASYYADPAYHSVMEAASNACARVGIAFSRDTGGSIRGSQRRQLNVGRAFGDRFTAMPAKQRAHVFAILEKEGGSTPLGRLEEVAHPDPRVARARINAMMCVRDLAYPLDSAVGPDTPVTRPTTPSRIPDIRALKHKLNDN